MARANLVWKEVYDERAHTTYFSTGVIAKNMVFLQVRVYPDEAGEYCDVYFNDECLEEYSSGYLNSFTEAIIYGLDMIEKLEKGISNGRAESTNLED